MKVIAIYNAKGGVGSTLLAAAFCILAAHAGVRVVGVSVDDNDHELRPWLALYGIRWFDATDELPQDADLVILDVRSTTELADVLRPDLVVMPMDNRTAFENAVTAAEMIEGPMVWVWSNVGDPEVVARHHVPPQLAGRAAFADEIILRDDAIAECAYAFRLACPFAYEAARTLETFVRSTLARVGLAIDELGILQRPWPGSLPPWSIRDMSFEALRERRRLARERLQGFFGDIEKARQLQLASDGEATAA